MSRDTTSEENQDYQIIFKVFVFGVLTLPNFKACCNRNFFLIVSMDCSRFIFLSSYFGNVESSATQKCWK